MRALVVVQFLAGARKVASGLAEAAKTPGGRAPDRAPRHFPRHEA